MSPVIRISEKLYERLENHATGFDTPSNVIEKMLDYYEDQDTPKPAREHPISSQEFVSPQSLEIIFDPGDEEHFKCLFLEQRIAYVRIFYTDGKTVDKVWRALKLTASSSVKGNLKTGYLRGWRQKGIYKAELTLEPRG